jgi:Tfp pilus assembly protein PilF
MNKYPYLILLILSMGVTCGFNWGFGSTDACTKAKVLTSALADLSGQKLTKQENKILKLCPEGAAGHFVLGLRHERQEEADKAIEEYRAAVESDETVAEGYKKGKRFNEAIAELHKVASAKPRDKEIHRLLAEVYRAKGELARAGKKYLLAGIDQPSSLDEYIRKGDKYLLSRKYGTAIECTRMPL